LPERSYDVVSAFHVLEHVPDARAFLRTLSRWVRPNGFVTIEVPNFNSTQRRRMGNDWPHLRPHEHLTHFTPQTLTRAVDGAGLAPVFERSPVYLGPPQTLDQALYDLSRQGAFKHLVEPLSRMSKGRGERVRYPNRAGWAVLRAVEALHDRAGVGSVVFCVARVP
jgi:hypothetical protein